MRNLLVTGGAGFIGSHFVRCALGADPSCHVVNLDRLTYAGSEDNLADLPDPARHRLVPGDIRDQALVEDLLHRHAIDTIVHLAAETHVDRSITSPAAFVEANIVGTHALLEAARRCWLQGGQVRAGRRFHHVSTDEVYGDLGPNAPPCREDAAYSPSSPYAASKAAADHLVRAYERTYGLPTSLSNCPNNYGPFQHPEKLIPVVITSALEGQPIPLYGDGLQRREWLFVEDHVRAIWRILEQGRPGQTYHIGGTWHGSNREIVEKVCDLIDVVRPSSSPSPRRSLVRFVSDRPGHDRRYALNNDKIAGELGWHSPTSLEAGLTATVNWYLGHPEWLARRRQSPGFQEWIETNYAGRGEAAR